MQFIDIAETFHEFKWESIYKIPISPDYLDTLKTHLNDKKTCTYEVLTQQIRRVYIDLDKIPTKRKRFIKKFLEDFASFTGIREKASITRNRKSRHHNGTSYHIVFPSISMDRLLLKNVIYKFKKIYVEYTPYLDLSVYSSFRLFRLPWQIMQKGERVTVKDFHQIQAGKIGDFIIQDTQNARLLTAKDLSCSISTKSPNTVSKFLSDLLGINRRNRYRYSMQGFELYKYFFQMLFILLIFNFILLHWVLGVV